MIKCCFPYLSLVINYNKTSLWQFSQTDLDSHYIFKFLYSTLSDGVSSTHSSSLIHSDSGVSIGGDQTKASKSSLLSTDSGIASDTSLNQQHTTTSTTQQLGDISGTTLYHRFALLVYPL